MRLRLILPTIVLLALAAYQPCFAKEAHARHGASATNKAASAKGSSVNRANPAADKANGVIKGEGTVPPPVLPPPQGVTQQRNRTVNPRAKIVTPGNTARRQAGRATAPAIRNAIGQPIVQSKGLAATQPHVPSALQTPGAVPPTLRGAPPVGPPVVSSNPTHATAPVANAAKFSNRGSVSGAGVIRPGAAPSTIGGATRPNYGINGTTVQTKH
jgi:hypothetical protein